MKRRNLLKHLAGHGSVVVREGKAHTVVRNTANDRRSSVPRHAEIKTTTARGICKQLGIPIPEER